MRNDLFSGANAVYLLILATPPFLLGFSWWGWFQDYRLQLAKWRALVLLSSICAGSANSFLFWAWVVWLHFHYTSASWRVRDVMSDFGLLLLWYSIFAALAGKGICRIMLPISGILAVFPWIPAGVL